MQSVDTALRSARILVVEDDADVREAVAGQLAEAGYSVYPTADGQEALERLLRGEPPDMILLDLKMPKRSGWELLEYLRRSSIFMGVPVVIFSAYVGFPPAGAVAWLRKPVTREDLLTAVRGVLARHR
jgi:CheY-like chemotaxis protein